MIYSTPWKPRFGTATTSTNLPTATAHKKASKGDRVVEVRPPFRPLVGWLVGRSNGEGASTSIRLARAKSNERARVEEGTEEDVATNERKSPLERRSATRTERSDEEVLFSRTARRAPTTNDNGATVVDASSEVLDHPVTKASRQASRRNCMVLMRNVLLLMLMWTVERTL